MILNNTIYFSTNKNDDCEKERKLYTDIINILYTNKEKIKYIKSKKTDNDFYFYFKYKNKIIEVSQYNWQIKDDEYNLTVDDKMFITTNSQSAENYEPLCEYLYNIGFHKWCKETKNIENNKNEKYNKELQDLIDDLKK